jgi:hypothetical protein
MTMTRARRRDARGRRYAGRFSRTVEDEVRFGIVWSDYHHVGSKYLLPMPGDSAEAAAASIRTARAAEVDLDEINDGEPGTPPSWPHWQGVR